MFTLYGELLFQLYWQRFSGDVVVFYFHVVSERERRLAYLLYHCGLQPTEIVRCCPQEWSDVQEVIRLRRIIFTQLISSIRTVSFPKP